MTEYWNNKNESAKLIEWNYKVNIGEWTKKIAMLSLFVPLNPLQQAQLGISQPQTKPPKEQVHQIFCQSVFSSRSPWKGHNRVVAVKHGKRKWLRTDRHRNWNWRLNQNASLPRPVSISAQRLDHTLCTGKITNVEVEATAYPQGLVWWTQLDCIVGRKQAKTCTTAIVKDVSFPDACNELL